MKSYFSKNTQAEDSTCPSPALSLAVELGSRPCLHVKKSKNVLLWFNLIPKHVTYARLEFIEFSTRSCLWNKKNQVCKWT